MLNLDFDGHNTLYATHPLHPYAAKCPPQLVHYGLRYYSKPGQIVLDPMMGSGTTLVEATLTGRAAIGFDIDPLALLIARVKCTLLDDKKVERFYERVLHLVEDDIRMLNRKRPPAEVKQRAVPPTFPNQEYWFDPSVAQHLALLLWHIEDAIRMPNAYRDFLRVAFSSLILAKNSVANARDIIHSRHHHIDHPQPPDVLKRFGVRVDVMRKHMADFQRRHNKTPAALIQSRLGDARCLRLDNESVDLVFTSPPYATALDYTRAHFLAVAWLQQAFDMSIDQYLSNGSTYIGTERGKLSPSFALDNQIARYDLASSVVEEMVKQSPRQAKLIQRYFCDMNQTLSEMARVLKDGRHAVIVVCPSHIRKMQIPTHNVLVEMGQANGLRLKYQHVRTINERRRLLPYMRESFGQRMSTEYVLILQKQ